jgi:UDP-glucuronate 4-epimerase
MTSKRILVAGAAGFIGSKVTCDLINRGFEVLGIDSFSNYYSPEYKHHRIRNLGIESNVRTIDIVDSKSVKSIFQEFLPNIVINLAAQGGVRASKLNPVPYILTNQLGFVNLLECSETYNAEKFIYASSSSVYGDGLTPPFLETSKLPAPKSLYAASKIANELIAQYFPSNETQRVGLRFFTVYGPMGRPDMAVFRLLASSLLNEPFNLTADLETSRDFTFVDDTAQTIKEVIDFKGTSLPAILNVAGSMPYTLSNVLSILETQNIKIKLHRNEVDPSDAKVTHGSTFLLNESNFSVPQTSLSDGLLLTWEWMKECNLGDIRNWYEYSS